ncbi:leucine-rich repeat protein, partial [Enterococcus faecalis]
QKKLLKSLRLTLATSMLATPVITNSAATVAYAQEHKEQQEKPVEPSVGTDKETNEQEVEAPKVEEATSETTKEAEQPKESNQKEDKKPATAESSPQQAVELPQKEQEIKEPEKQVEKSSENKKEYDTHQINWNEFSKTLDITVNQADINDVAEHMKEEFEQAIGAVEVLVLHGSFDDTPLSFGNYNVIGGKKVTGDVTQLAPKMFIQNTNVTTVNLPNVTVFHGDEFNLVSTIEEVEVGMKAEDTLATVKEIFSDSVDNIKKLKVNNITDTGNVGFFEEAPFKNVETVELPVATSIGTSAFQETPLTSVELPVATNIDSYAFQGTQLTSVNLPSATIIASDSFEGTPLTSVELPVATRIDPYAFEGTQLTSVNLPSATSIATDAFKNVTTIEEVEVGMKAEDTLATVKERFSASAGNIKKLKVNNITDTGEFAYNTNPFKNVETVDLPVATSIGSYAFSYTPLTNVNLPSATSIGDYAFGYT